MFMLVKNIEKKSYKTDSSSVYRSGQIVYSYKSNNKIFEDSKGCSWYIKWKGYIYNNGYF